jgi:cellulose biosynthesis protein BcsQ
MSRVITFASAKGGSGKTTLTATMGLFLSSIGFRVLMVDCDEATNGLTLLYIDQVNSRRQSSEPGRPKCVGILEEYDVSKQMADVVELDERLDFIPAVYSFESRDQISADEFSIKLRELKKDYEKDYDYILLDAQAGSDSVSLAAVEKKISELVIVVSEYDPLSAAGVERLKGIAPQSFSFDRTWILLNKMLPEFIESFSEFLSVSHYLPPLPWTADVVRSYAKRELALDFEKGNEFTLAALQTIRALPFPELKSRIQVWTDGRAEIIRQPVIQQYSDMEALLEGASRRINQIKNIRKRRSLFTGIASLFILISLTGILLIRIQEKTVFSKYFIDEKSTLLVLAAGALSMMVATFSFGRTAAMVSEVFSLFGLRVDDEDDLELQRLERQKRVYLQQLEELEFLRSADAESIVKKKFSQ